PPSRPGPRRHCAAKPPGIPIMQAARIRPGRIFSVSYRTDACGALELIMHRLPTSPYMSPARVLLSSHVAATATATASLMPRELAMCPMCRVLLVGGEHQRREGHVEHRQPFLERISYPALLLVAAVFGFEGTRIALGASEAVKAKPGPPAAFRIEMAKPPQCSIETPDRLVFL